MVSPRKIVGWEEISITIFKFDKENTCAKMSKGETEVKRVVRPEWLTSVISANFNKDTI